MLDIEKLKGTETPTEVGLKINEIIETSGTSSRNIGELVPSLLPQTDAGLHLVDGALINGDGAYADFVDYIANLYGDGTAIPSYFTTEEEWQTSVVNYGVCGKFVYDSVANTVRLPKATGIIEGTIDLSALGDLVEAGLPNITGTVYGLRSRAGTGTTSSGAFSNQTDAGQSAGGSGNTYNDGTWTLSFDASRSSNVYGNSNTVQPQTIKGFVYICIATSKKTDVEVNIDNVMTDVNGKANKTDVDGQWVVTDIELGNFTAITSSTVYLDLTDILPKDGYKYQIVGYWETARNDTGGTDSQCRIFNNDKAVIKFGTDGNNQRHTVSYSTIVDTTRKNIGYFIGANALASGALYLASYRRLGTNQ